MPPKKGAIQKKGAKKKKQTDTFLKKEWYVVKVPTYFSNQQNKWRIGYTPAKKAGARKQLDNRTFVVNLGDLQDDWKKNEHTEYNYKKYTFATEEVFGFKLLTQWHGMEITRDKRCSLIRKRHSMIQCTVDAKTTDGYILRVMALAFTARQQGQVKKNAYAKHSQERIMRARMRDVIKNHISSETLQGVVNKLNDDVLGKDILKTCKLIYPLKDSLIEKVKVMRKPKRDVSRLMEMHELQTEFDQIPKEELEELGLAAEDAGAETEQKEQKEQKKRRKSWRRYSGIKKNNKINVQSKSLSFYRFL